MADVNVKVQSEAINGLAEKFRFEFMNFLYSGNDPDYDEKDDLTYIVELHGLLNDILREVACIESERDRQKLQASKLRTQWGAAFLKECDEAGIE